jgi:hypothetical protein
MWEHDVLKVTGDEEVIRRKYLLHIILRGIPLDVGKITSSALQHVFNIYKCSGSFVLLIDLCTVSYLREFILFIACKIVGDKNRSHLENAHYILIKCRLYFSLSTMLD